MPDNIAQNFALQAVPFLFALGFHEFSHAYVAHKLGDNTAKDEGRMTINPLVHADMFGTVIFPIILLLLPGSLMFGWAKPVPVLERNLSWRKYGMLTVALAGPMSNILLTVICSILYVYLFFHMQASPTKDFIVPMLLFSCKINIVLAVFNMIPVPPLDGSKVVAPFLSYEFKQKLLPFAPYGLIAILGLSYLGVLNVLFYPAFALFSWFIESLKFLI